MTKPFDNLIDLIMDMTYSVLPNSEKAKDLDIKLNRANAVYRRVTGSNSQYANSLRSKADKFILQYPIVTSTSIDADMIETIRNNIELNQATLLQMVLNNSPMEMYHPEEDDFLPTYHSNMNINESTVPYTQKETLLLNEQACELYEDRLNTHSLNEMTLPRDFILARNLREAEEDEEFEMYDVTYSPDRKKKTYHNKDGTKKTVNFTHVDGSEREGLYTYYYDDGSSDVYFDNKEIGDSNKVSIKDMNKFNRSTPLNMSVTVNYVYSTRMIFDGNDRLLDDNDKRVTPTTIQLGIKGILHGVESEDVIYFLGDSAKSANLLTNFVKLTTGEMKLVDLLFRTSRSKRSAQASRKKNNVWKNLNDLGVLSNGGRFARANGGPGRSALVPTTTLVISIDEVDQIQARTGRSILNDKKVSNKIYTDLFLMDLMVVDEANGIYYQYDPKNKNFDRGMLSSLEGGRITDSMKSKGVAAGSAVERNGMTAEQWKNKVRDSLLKNK